MSDAIYVLACVFDRYGNAVAPNYPSIVVSSFSTTTVTFTVPALPSSYPPSSSIQYSVMVRPAGFPVNNGIPNVCTSTNGGYPTSTNTAKFTYTPSNTSMHTSQEHHIHQFTWIGLGWYSIAVPTLWDMLYVDVCMYVCMSIGDCTAATMPTITGISPSSGPAYTVVTINGKISICARIHNTYQSAACVSY